ncbi:MBL fold metallo-hydrolase [Gordonia alkaliphila]|uniref:MBL fold metallo-hydrolase n=1 Tax=Gordonia alkaliphila TaxID=1053547 RepID=A0ABP8YWD3_9ACTN|nr:MBL fold metallo-hydrolase [Gordonia alkaliphila]MCK0439654.1 MBL fold metallo-hydrolase [Gordonia alkaliphila]
MTSIRSLLSDGVAEPVGSAMVRGRRAAARLGAAGAQLSETAFAGAVDLLADRGFAPARALGATHEDLLAATAGSAFAVDGVFGNREPSPPPTRPTVSMSLQMARNPGVPSAPVPVLTPKFDAEPADLAATWLGHASVLLEIDGVRVLTDPVFSKRCSPTQRIGPQRMHALPAEVGALGPVDIVLISHDHYDHLDMATIDALAALQPQAQFVAPIGVDAHLRSWGVPAERIHTADWFERVTLDVRGTQLRFHATPARHFSGRGLVRNLSQWVSWVVVGPRHRVFFSGDTGFTERYAETGELLGPFDLTIMAIGAYDPLWPDVHVNPEEAVVLHRLLNGPAKAESLFFPIHWGTFLLAPHTWADPVQRLLTAAGGAGIPVVVPRPGAAADVGSRTGTAFDDPTWWERCA